MGRSWELGKDRVGDTFVSVPAGYSLRVSFTVDAISAGASVVVYSSMSSESTSAAVVLPWPARRQRVICW